MISSTITLKELQTLLVEYGVIFWTVRCDGHGKWTVKLGSINERDPKIGKGDTLADALSMALSK
jgi:hypothetical protein